MSWWDSYLAPGDLRRRQQSPSPPTPTPPSITAANDGEADTITSTPSHTPDRPRIAPAHRARRQNALFLGGLTFTLLSFALTRRTVLRKRVAAYPSTFTPSHMHIEPPPGPQQQMTKVEGSLMAIEALGLATLNVCSVFMAGIGGAMIWFDVAEVEDLRQKVGDGGEIYGGEADEEAEREVEGWIANAFGQGQGQEQKGGAGAGELGQGVLGMLQELQKEKSERGGGGG